MMPMKHNEKRLLLMVPVLVLTLGLGACQEEAQPEKLPQSEEGVPASTMNGLSDEEKADGWKLLFNGKDLTGWRGFRMEEAPPGWEVSDGTLHFDAEHGGEGYGDLTTVDQYADFELKLEWKISAGGNSGVLFRVTEDHEQEFHTGPEIQVLDGAEEYYPGLDDTQQTGGNYALHPPARDVVKPVGTWNQLRLVVHGPHVEHWLNGEKLVEYELWTDEWKELVARSKFAQWPQYGMNKKGHIVLQDHGAAVWYRDLKIRLL